MGHLTKEHFDAILRRAQERPYVYIETGCNRGDQLVIAAPLFREVFGIELDERYALEAVNRVPSAEIIVRDTREVLPVLLNKLSNEPVFIVLDAHYCALNPPIQKSPFPLWDELILLRARKQPDIIVIDDVHTFGKVRNDLRYGAAPEWEGVTAAALSSFLSAPGEVIGDGYVVWR